MQHYANDDFYFIACIGKNEFDLDMDPLHPAIELLRNICRAQRTYANKYVVLGQLCKPTGIKADTILIERPNDAGPGGPKGAHGKYKDKFVEFPLVMHSVWKAPDGNMGYVLINWTGSDQQVVLNLLPDKACTGYERNIHKVTANGWEKIGIEKPDSITTVVPQRDIILIEEVFI